MKEIDIDRIDEYSIEELQAYIQQFPVKSPRKKIRITEPTALALLLNIVPGFILAPATIIEFNIRSWWWSVPIFIVFYVGLGILEYLTATLVQFVSGFFEIVED